MGRRLTIWLSVVAGLAGGCAPVSGPDVVAVVDGEALRYQEFSDYVTASVDRNAEALRSEVLEALFDQFLDQAIATKLAEREAPPGTPSERLFEVWVDGLVIEDPMPAEVQARYRRERSRFSLPRRAVLRQIMVPSLERAREVRSELEAGASFAAVADRMAGEEFSPAGGLQGTFAASDLPAEVAEAVFALESGEVSGILEMEGGYALFQVDRFQEAEELSFEAVRESLRREMRAERRQRALEQRVAAHRTPEHVTIYLSNLPFEYDGAYKDLADETN